MQKTAQRLNNDCKTIASPCDHLHTRLQIAQGSKQVLTHLEKNRRKLSPRPLTAAEKIPKATFFTYSSRSILATLNQIIHTWNELFRLLSVTIVIPVTIISRRHFDRPIESFSRRHFTIRKVFELIKRQTIFRCNSSIGVGMFWPLMVRKF